MKNQKVLILQGIVPLYRDPLFNFLSDKYELTIGYTLHSECTPLKYKIERISFIKLFSLFLPTFSFIKYVNKYDVVIIMPDMHYFNYCILPFLPIRAKVISWSIGMRASYKLKYDIKRNKELLDYFFLMILKRCNANIFYYKHPLFFWNKLLNNKKIFIANNTVKVIDDKENFQKRDTILFLGSLIEGKGILMLIELYNELLQNNFEFSLKLKIIGGGPLEKKIKDYIQNQNLSNNIQLCGSIHDETLLRDHFSSTIMCVSPNQAGLSVLKSMGHGVPFVTSYDAITGGEKFAIQDGVNGLFYSKRDDLKLIMKNADRNRDKFLEMGNNSKSFFNKNFTIDIMAEGFTSAIEYVSNKNNK